MPTRDDWAILYDLDGTLIRKIFGSLMRLVADSLGEKALADVTRIRATYGGMFSSGRMSQEIYLTWLFEEIELYVRHRLKADAWRAALSQVRLREGAVEAIRAFHAEGLPQGVVSAAIADFAEYVLEVNGVLPLVDAVYATKLTYDDGQAVSGYQGHTVVHPGNKGDCSREFADRFGVPHERIIAVGDSPGDVTIGHLRRHRIVIAETEEEARFLRSLDFMEEVVVSDDLGPVTAWIRRRIGLPPI